MATPVTRADVLSGTKTKRDFFSDFVTSFAKTPYGDQLGRVTNEDAVNQSLKNLIRTNLGERLFQPLIGSDVNAMLFENNMPDVSIMLETFIKNTIKNNEPRVNLISVDVNTETSNEHNVDVTIVYNLINSPEQITLTVLLRRVR